MLKTGAKHTREQQMREFTKPRAPAQFYSFDYQGGYSDFKLSLCTFLLEPVMANWIRK